MSKNKKDNRGFVFSTDPEFQFQFEEETTETLSPSEQRLKVTLDKKQRGGKEVTLVTGFVGSDEDLKTLGKMLKTKCGVGGSAKDNEIIVQGNFVDKIKVILKEAGYK